MENRKKHFGLGLLCGVLLSVLLAGGWYAVSSAFGFYRSLQAVSASGDEELIDEQTARKADVIEDVIRTYYLEDVEKDALREGIYKGIVEALGDPYSMYFTEKELQEQMDSMEGIYYGIGATIRRNVQEDCSYINGTIEGSPAQAAGLMEGDIIRKVDGKPVDGLSQTEIVALIKGENGTTVRLSLERDGQLIDIDVKRGEVEDQTVSWEMAEGGVAHIQIAEFDTVTEKQFTQAMAECENQGMQSLVLDLRGNPGGNLTTVCEIARQLLPKGLIVYTEDKQGRREEYTCKGENEFQKPLAVLVDGGSASASEILSGAIKDYGIGTLIGTTTYGKGVVQRPVQLTDGSAVKVTISKYYTPKGNDINKVGIEPDIEVPWDYQKYLEDGTDNQLEFAISYLKEK